MSAPKSVVRFKKQDGKTSVIYTSNVDFAQYSICQLSRAAMKDVGKYIVRLANEAAMQLHGGGLKKTKRARGKTSTFLYSVPFAADGELPHVDITVGHSTWYGIKQELGSYDMPKQGILRNTAYNNTATIVEIESKYLSALEDEAAALAAIDEAEVESEGVENG